jgi:hypothetical protein
MAIINDLNMRRVLKIYQRGREDQELRRNPLGFSPTPLVENVDGARAIAAKTRRG